jgi:hypothetical protein
MSPTRPLGVGEYQFTGAWSRSPPLAAAVSPDSSESRSPDHATGCLLIHHGHRRVQEQIWVMFAGVAP